MILFINQMIQHLQTAIAIQCSMLFVKWNYVGYKISMTDQFLFLFLVCHPPLSPWGPLAPVPGRLGSSLDP